MTIYTIKSILKKILDNNTEIFSWVPWLFFFSNFLNNGHGTRVAVVRYLKIVEIYFCNNLGLYVFFFLQFLFKLCMSEKNTVLCWTEQEKYLSKKLLEGAMRNVYIDFTCCGVLVKILLFLNLFSARMLWHFSILFLSWWLINSLWNEIMVFFCNVFLLNWKAYLHTGT